MPKRCWFRAWRADSLPETAAIAAKKNVLKRIYKKQRSSFVHDAIVRHGEFDGRARPFLPAKILDIAKLLVVPGAIPERAGPDAIHIAAAAVEECDYLLTWNFRHIANVRIRREVERILARHGYTKTTICTPEELV
ncbi:MAG: hypothetical protein ACREUU_13395 [Gammaproteobacteria bacterium]